MIKDLNFSPRLSHGLEWNQTLSLAWVKPSCLFIPKTACEREDLSIQQKVFLWFLALTNRADFCLKMKADRNTIVGTRPSQSGNSSYVSQIPFFTFLYIPLFPRCLKSPTEPSQYYNFSGILFISYGMNRNAHYCLML